MTQHDNPRAATLAQLLELADHQAKQFVGRTEAADPGDLAMLALHARGVAATFEAVADHASAAALVAIDRAEDED